MSLSSHPESITGVRLSTRRVPCQSLLISHRPTLHPSHCAAPTYTTRSNTQVTLNCERTRPYKCTECDYATTHKGHLTQHLRKHSGERPFKCETCDYRVRPGLSWSIGQIQLVGEIGVRLWFLTNTTQIDVITDAGRKAMGHHSPHSNAHWRKTIWMPVLHISGSVQVRYDVAYSDPHGGEAIQVRIARTLLIPMSESPVSV